MKTRARIVLTLALALLGGRARAQFCSNCIMNSAAPQNAVFNVTSGTIRGLLTVEQLSLSDLVVNTIEAGVFTGSGTNVTNLNASQLLLGTVPSARVAGAYSGITGVGTVTSGVWNGSPLGTQYGGTGQNFAGVGGGALLGFSNTGVMAPVLTPTYSGVLQTAGNGAVPVWVSSPALQGYNFTNLPLGALTAGTLSSSIAVTDGSLSTVSAAKVSGNISGGAEFLTLPLPINNLAAGQLPTSIPASSITATGVTAMVYGGPLVVPQLTVGGDGRIYAAAQYSLAVPTNIIQPGALPNGVTIAAGAVTAGILPDNVQASSVAANGTNAGTFGGAARSLTITNTIDGRITSIAQQNIALPLNQLNNGTLPVGVAVPAESILSGDLGPGVLASNLAPNGVVAGTYGSSISYAIVTVDASGRVTDATSHSFTGITPATNTVTTNIFGYVPNTQLDPGVVTLQGNNFNGPSQLVRNLGSGALPAVSGVNLTALTGANVVGPVATSTALAVTPTAAPSGFVSRGIDASGNSLNARVDATAIMGSTNPIQSGAVFGMSGFNGGVVQNFALFQSSAEFVGAVVGHSSGTFSSLFADGSHLTGIPTGPCVSTGTLQGVVCAGQSNVANAVHQAVFIAGGGFNQVNQDYGFAAGYNNTVAGGGSISAAVGGEFNTNSGVNSFMGGGNTNTINSGSQSAIVGGGNHLLDGSSSFMGGGNQNTINGSFAAIVGGQLDVATATYAMAAGYKAHANEQGSYVWADSAGTIYNSHGADTWNARPAGGFWFDGDIKSINSVPYSWPSSQGGANTALKNDGAGNLSWAAAGGSPGGATTQVQFNDSGAFNGDDAMRWDNGGKSLRMSSTANDPGYAGTVVAYAATDTPLFAGTDGANDNFRALVTATPVSGVRISASRLIFTAAGNNGIIIQTNGFVGFGNNPTPAYVIDAIGDINASNYLRLGGVASISRSGSQVVFGTGNADIDDTGFISVGAAPVTWYHCLGGSADRVYYGTSAGNIAECTGLGGTLTATHASFQ